MKTTYLELSWSTSRGRDTYGYNITRLDDRNTGKRYKCSGGGYDTTGTVLGEWLQDVYQTELLALSGAANSTYSRVKGASTYSDKPSYYKHAGRELSECKLYGMTFYEDDKKVVLDGACGVESMLQIAICLGLDVERVGDKKGRTIGFVVSEGTTK